MAFPCDYRNRTHQILSQWLINTLLGCLSQGTEIWDIELAQLLELCDEVVVQDEKGFKALWTRLGMSYDWDQEYATINEHCRRIAQ